MRSKIDLSYYKISPLLNDKRIKHRFFYKCDSNNNFYDFQSPLSESLIESVLNELKLDRLIVLNQNHTPHVVIYPSLNGEKFADGIITNQKRVGLLVRHADCQAALFYDPKKQVIAAVHAGFRGQVHQIYKKTVAKMQKHFDCHPSNILVSVSAGLGLAHSEFINYKEEFPQELHRYACNNFMDLKKMAFDELKEAGLLEENIDIDPSCTFEREDLYFSYRRDKTKMRMGSIIGLF